MSENIIKEGRYTCGPEVIQRALELGLTVGELRTMVVKSVRITHPKGNRRYHNYLFQVDSGEVVDIQRMDDKGHVGDVSIAAVEQELSRLGKVMATISESIRQCYGVLSSLKGKPVNPTGPKPDMFCESCRGGGRVQVFDECLKCGGVGGDCSNCDEGLVSKYIPCPICMNRREGKISIKK